MNTNLIRSPAPLRDAFYALALEGRIPDSDMLDTVIRKYPEHSEALTAFAIELALDMLRGEQADNIVEAPVDATHLAPEVSRALSRFQNRLHEVRQSASEANSSKAMQAPVANPFAALDRTAFRGFAARLNANTVFVALLRDRQIDPDTMTDGFRRRVSDELNAPLDLVVAHFSVRSPILARSQYFKAAGKPALGEQQTFTDAVRNCGLSEEQQRYLLNL